MKKLLLWLLSLIFGPKIVAAEQGAEDGINKFEAQAQAEAVAVVQKREDEIDADTAEQKAEVAAAPDAALDAELERVCAVAESANRDRTGKN